MTLEEALDIYSRPKERRRGVAKPPIKELGIDPTSQKALIIKDGRFGMYVTDGETNATLRRGDTAEGMTLDRGLELLAGRRAWEAENGPSPKKTRKKAAALDKKGSAKKGETAPTLTKNVVKKAGAKKAAKKAASGKAKKKAE
jgi:DNA topoisomerase-1